MNRKKQIFKGIKVADFSWVGVGPQVVRELAEHGAKVIRVECHRYPDTLRTIFPFKDFKPGIDRSAFGACYNTNKYGMSLDLNMPKGQEVAKRLVEWADVITDSMTPGTMAKWGLDYENCQKIKPDIIYYSTCQMGQIGPYAKFGGYGMFGTSYAGFCHLLGWPDRSPLPLFNNYTDFISPWYLCLTLILALLRRMKTGKGMYLDQSQVEVGAQFIGQILLDYTVNGRIQNRLGNRDNQMAPHGIYRCKGENRWIAIAVMNNKQWNAFCNITDNTALANDPRYTTILQRKQNEDELDNIISRWTCNYTPEQVMEMMQKEGIPAGIVETAEDLFKDPQLKHRKHFRFMKHRVIGNMAFNSPAYQLSKTPNHIWKVSPCLGEDNDYVYREILGYSKKEIAEMLAEGVITTKEDVPAVLKE
ncbi:MAG: CoA transferase [Spirochaetota bacterium]|nr:CoA transferase [Spirochaetota bacterium]